MPQIGQTGEKIEQLGGGFCAVTSGNHTFGSDAILLANFSTAYSVKKLCDLCAGCGIVSIIWAAGDKERRIDAVEIQAEAIHLIEKAIHINKFSNIRPVMADLKTLGAEFNSSYDLVACNPPYKEAGTGAVSKSAAAMIARHETFCTLSDIVTVSSRILKNGGRLCMCHRPERLADLICLMREAKVESKRLRFVQQRADTKPWLVLIEGKKGAKPGLIMEPPLIVEGSSGGYSAEMRAIYNKLECADA